MALKKRLSCEVTLDDTANHRLLTSSMAIAFYVYGTHSTPGINLAFANLPGSLVGIWASRLVEENIALYAVCGLVNWAFYFSLAKGAMLLRRKF